MLLLFLNLRDSPQTHLVIDSSSALSSSETMTGSGIFCFLLPVLTGLFLTGAVVATNGAMRWLINLEKKRKRIYTTYS